MRILTWNVNVLRTCLDYHPFSSMTKKNVEGLLDELDAQIYCFQEHKTRRPQLERSMACPGPYDGFWTFPRSKTGYSGVCTYVDSRYCVPVKAEEGITGLLLGDTGSTMRPPWTADERIGHYPDVDDLEMEDELGGVAFDVKRLDTEGRAVVCDFGLFVLFNLYCPNETNDARRPYKMNFLHTLQARVRALQAAGREVIIAGDINIMRAPIDSGEGGIRTSAEQHYEHPARVILNDWIAPRGPMIDVVRESWPDRDDMFTCWNQKLDARPANYGSRIDLILCTPGLRPWISGGDIMTKVYGSDHCPVYIDLHEEVTMPDGQTLRLKDQLNPIDRPPTTAQVYPAGVDREAPEPPRFATKFLEEFSGRQTTLKSFFGGGSSSTKRSSQTPVPSSLTTASLTPPTARSEAEEQSVVDQVESKDDGSNSSNPVIAPVPVPSSPFGLARAAFAEIDNPTSISMAGPSKVQRRSSNIINIDEEEGEAYEVQFLDQDVVNGRGKREKSGSKSAKPSVSGQTKLSSFFSQPTEKRKTVRSETIPPPSKRSTSSSPVAHAATVSPAETHDAIEDQIIAQAIAEADAAKAQKRAATNAEATPVWNNLFAPKATPLCTVHQKPCKDFIVKIPGPNKGKRFWLCSLPVGPGYDSGRTKRAREDVNPNFRCDFFLWDSANRKREAPRSLVPAKTAIS